MFGRPPDDEIFRLRYQLLHGLGGTVREAQVHGASLAVFVVHELLSTNTKEHRVAANHADFQRFLAVMTGAQTHQCSPGQLEGPFLLTGAQDIPLYVGKVQTRIES